MDGQSDLGGRGRVEKASETHSLGGVKSTQRSGIASPCDERDEPHLYEPKKKTEGGDRERGSQGAIDSRRRGDGAAVTESDSMEGAAVESSHDIPMRRWEGKVIGSRRRNRSDTDSNATLEGGVIGHCGEGPTNAEVVEAAEGERESSTGSASGTSHSNRNDRKREAELTIVTGNGGGMGKIKEFLSKNTGEEDERRMDIVLAQEHHLAEDDLGEGLAWCRQAGWKALASAATRTEAGGTRGGLLMAFRPRIGAGLAPGETEVTLVPGRLMACHVNALSKGVSSFTMSTCGRQKACRLGTPRRWRP